MTNNIKTYTYNEVFNSTLDYFNGDDLATNVWITKYCKTEIDDNGVTTYYEKNPDDMFRRIAREISRAGMKYDNPLSENEVYDLIKEYKYILFAGRPMAGIGVDDKVSISNCFVVGRPGQDSYGTIATIDQEIMQLSKRGGGCIWENTNVVIKDKGIVPIKDVNVGDYILSFNINTRKDEWKRINDKYYTDVKLEDQIELEYSNGTRLKTSKKHPILWLDKDGYKYKSFNDGYAVGFTNRTITNSDFNYCGSENDDIAWLIGHHIGDGTIGNANSKHNTRIRILGDNKEVIDKYASILGNITGSVSAVKQSTRKSYKSTVWEYTSNNKNNTKFIDLIDNQVGSKTYTCFIPKFIKDNDLYIPFIAGLIDADGFVDEGRARIDVSICSKTLIRELSEYLSLNGQPYHISFKKSKRLNEKTIYRLIIPKRASIIEYIKNYITHPKKLENLNIVSNKLHSYVIELTNKEVNKINDFKATNIDDEKMRKLFQNNRINCRKRGGKMAIPGLHLCYNLGIFTNEEYTEMISRVNTVSINEDNSEKLNYIDIEVEDNNNYYAGEFGFVNIHNCGTDISDYRPNGSRVHNAAKTSSGPVDICATRFSNTIREVCQNGRRGALMLSMDITHPSAEEFIDAKMEDGKITGANISVKLYDNWLKSALGIDCEMDMEKNRIWKKIVHNATAKAEPGILFWDTAIRESVPDCYKDFGYKTTSTNPCGEILLCPDDSCRLMALNLYSYVDNPFTKDAKFNYPKFIDHCKKTMKIMDNMIELELEKIDAILAKIETDPEDEDIKMVEKNLWTRIRKKCKEGRRSGIGITAMGDMLAALGISYGTKKATEFTTDIQRILATAVYIESCDLVQRDNRPAFGCFDFELEKNNPFLYRLANEFTYGNEAQSYIEALSADFKKKWVNGLGRRNIACLTIAPTGSLSTQTQTTSGIEPVFMISYRRRRKIDKNSGIIPDFIDKTGDAFIEFNVVHNKFIEWYRVNNNLSFNDAKKYLEGLSVDKLNDIIRMSPYFGATAMDCDWHERVNMQGNIQKYVDHSISVTVNLPRGTSEDVVEDVYKTAWLAGCKGCTIYVDGSRDGVLITKDEPKKKCECTNFTEVNAPKRPKKLPCKIVRFSNKGEKWIAAVGLHESKPYEIFSGLADKLNIPSSIGDGFIVRNKVNKDVFDDDEDVMKTIKVSRYDFEYEKNGETITVEGLSTIFNEEFWNYGKLISGLLRHGMPINYVVKVISTLDFGKETINSWKQGIIRTLKTFMKDEDLHEPCPKCGGHLRRESGCIQCLDCGWSKCGAN